VEDEEEDDDEAELYKLANNRWGANA